MAMAWMLPLGGYLVCGAAFLRHAHRVLAHAAYQRQRRRSLVSSSSTTTTTAVFLSATWHVPLLALGVTLLALRVVVLTGLTLQHHHDQDASSPLLSSSQRALLMFADAVTVLTGVFCVAVHAHVVHFRAWPTVVRHAIAIIGGAFAGLVLFMVLLLVGLLAQELHQPPHRWQQEVDAYFALLWLLLGTSMLTYQARSVAILRADQECYPHRPRRPLMSGLSRSNLLAFSAGQTLLALLFLLRGAVMVVSSGLLSKHVTDWSVSPERLTVLGFVLQYMVWDVVISLLVMQLTRVVPVVCTIQPVISARTDDGSGNTGGDTDDDAVIEGPEQQQQQQKESLPAAALLASARLLCQELTTAPRDEEARGHDRQYEAIWLHDHELGKAHEPLLLKEEEDPRMINQT